MNLVTFTSLKKPVTATSLEGFVIMTSPRIGCNTSCVRIVGESFFITKMYVTQITSFQKEWHWGTPKEEIRTREMLHLQKL